MLLLFVALFVAAATLTVGLVLHGQTATPYAATRSATAGPDVVGTVFPAPGRGGSPARVARLAALAHHPSVRAASGLLPQTWASFDVLGIRAVAAVQGRNVSPGPVDRPQVVSGSWVRPGGVVVERAFAEALALHVGDRVIIDGRSVPVVGIAVTAALPAYPQVCTVGCILDRPGWRDAKPGLAWATRPLVRSLATRQEPLVRLQYLRLADPDAAPRFAATHGVASPLGPTLFPWQEIARRHAELLDNERAALLFGSSLLVVLALATVVVLVGGRMADEVHRVGTLKAIGATPVYVARTLVTTYAAIGLASAALGLLAGRVLAPHLVRRSAGLIGATGATSVTLLDAAIVIAAVLAVVFLAALVPAWRAATTSTVSALADGGRRPRRSAAVIRISASLPTPALLGLRLAARRPRRAFLTVCSVAVAACGGVALLFAQASLGAERGPAGGPADPNAAMLHTVLVGLCVPLAAMVAVILVFVARSTYADARTSLAVARALGATPSDAVLSIAAAQAFPALIGLVAGVPAGVLLVDALGAHLVAPGAPALVLLAACILAACIVLTSVTAAAGRHRSISETLRET
ncbi:MAG: putative transport system permease protein [Nocardioidaceae bacterium]|nr:putative transport system permease protein [Nocardioidaceae bacterium]